MSDETRVIPMEGPDMVEETTISGGVSLAYQGATRDILKVGPSAELRAQMALGDLRDAIHPPACPECGHRPGRILGQVEDALREIRKDLAELGGAAYRASMVRKTVLLLHNHLERLPVDWADSLTEDKRLEWAGTILGLLRKDLLGEAQEVLHRALGAAEDAGTD